jgi:hypothetical protein
MSDEEYFATRAALRQILGRLKALHNNDAPLPGRVAQHIRYATEHAENALKALRGEPTSAAG